jgi:predicted AlkP superfamily pyrophosphatase or phosphodiesterase
LKNSGLLFFVCLGFIAATSTPASAERDDPYLILISLDGFGWRLQESNDTPGMDRIAAAGVRAQALHPVYPATTFANHYSIATGLYPFEHGIIDNQFPNVERSAWYRVSDRNAVEDGSWYGGEPIWVSAEKNGITSAAFFFVGTEAAIGGISPSYWKRFDASIPGDARVRQVLDWLALPDSERPHMITLYFEHVDTAGHDFGLGSWEHEVAIGRVDEYLVQLLDGIEALDVRDDVSVIVVSDHGQAQYQATSDAFVITDFVDLDGVTVLNHGSYVSIYVDPSDQTRAREIRNAVNDSWSNGRAYLRSESPDHWRVTSDARFADIVILADPHYRVISDRSRPLRVNGADHGWDPSFEGMYGIFLASGPRLPAGVTVGHINNVDVYPLMMNILGLPLPDDISSDTNILVPLLKDQERSRSDYSLIR